MARPGITYDDVKETALALLGQGCVPSIQRIREQLGTGSNSTISEHLKRWRQEVSATPRTVLPATVPQAVLEALERFWGIALEQAEALYQEARARDQEQVRTAQQARDDARRDQQQAQAETVQLQRQAAGLSTQVRTLEDQLLVEREQRAAAQAAIAAAQHQAAAAMAAGERLRDELQARIAALEEALRQSRTEQAQQLAEADQRLHYERERGEAGEQRLMQIIDQLRIEHAQERRLYSEEGSARKAREAALQAQLQALHNDLAAVRAAAAAAEERARVLDADLGRARAQGHELEARCRDQLQALATLRGELRAVAQAREALAADLDACRQALLACQQQVKS